jgi:hypothetical protein
VGESVGVADGCAVGASGVVGAVVRVGSGEAVGVCEGVRVGSGEGVAGATVIGVGDAGAVGVGSAAGANGVQAARNKEQKTKNNEKVGATLFLVLCSRSIL